MREHKQPTLVLFIFLLIIFIVPVYWVICGNCLPEFSIMENRKLKRFSIAGLGFKTVIQELLNGNYSTAKDLLGNVVVERYLPLQIEGAASDQFPFRTNLIKFNKGMDRKIINLTYLLQDDPAIPTDMQSGYCVMRDRSAIIAMPAINNDTTRAEIDKRLKNYEWIISEYPNINFYAFYIEQLQYSPLHPLNQYFINSDRGQSLDYFIQRKPDQLVLETFRANSLEDYWMKFYKTDHHWNVHGVLLAYEMLVKLFEVNNPAISGRVNDIKIIGFPNVEFLGSYAKITSYPIDAESFNGFVNQASYKVIKEGQEFIYGNRNKYLDGIYSTDKYANHYGDYFGYDFAYLEFIFEEKNEHNLLIIGDSFDNAILPLIASHYDHTYSVDLRHNLDFSLEKFLSNHSVDDILIIGTYSTVLSSDKGIVNP